MEKSISNSGFGGTARLGNQDSTWTEMVREEPIASLAIAAALGFILGGGIRQSRSLPILTMLGQIVVRELFGDLRTEG
jgi:hypothetical protein